MELRMSSGQRRCNMPLKNKEIKRRETKTAAYDYPDSIVSIAIGGLLSSFLNLALKEKIFPLLKNKKMSLGQFSRRLKMPLPATLRTVKSP